jgi:catalase
VTTPDIPFTTTDLGLPALSEGTSLTVGPTGPILLHDRYLAQKMQRFTRERVPERVVHAKGCGAHGFFEATADATWFTRASLLCAVGKVTPLFVRFSTMAGETGYPDTVRDPRGFAVKFYTDEGNWDLVGNNTPVFFVRDPSKFSDFIHSQKRHPQSGLHSNDMQWDFWTLAPESAHQVTILMSDRGTPRTWRHMHGHSSHTFSTVNANGERFWVKWHLRTSQGIDNFTASEATAVAAEDPDFHRRDLRDAIDRADYPEWQLEVQVMPCADAAAYRFNPFDLTKVWPHSDYPPLTLGRLVLDRNPENYFAQVEQVGFSPANLVPGMGLSPDPMLMGRILSYHDAHLYRIGPSYEQLPINAPLTGARSYGEEGAMTHRHPGLQPVYQPNSHGGPAADVAGGEQVACQVEVAEFGRYAGDHHKCDDDFLQPGILVRGVMTQTDRRHLIANIVEHASNEVSRSVQQRVAAYWALVDPTVGAAVAHGLRITPSDGDGLVVEQTHFTDRSGQGTAPASTADRCRGANSIEAPPSQSDAQA